MIYLTKYMIEDYLTKQKIPVRVCGKEPWKFFDISYCTGSEWNPALLYFPDDASAFSAPVCKIHVLDSEKFAAYESEAEEIVCCGTPDLIYKTLLSCFSFYKNWYLTLQECLLKGGKLQNLVDKSVSIFDNPIAVSDIGFQVLAYTKEYHRQMEDAESLFIVKNSCHSPNYIHQITQHTAFIENLRCNRGPFRYHYDFLQHESIYCTIWLHNKPVGFLTIVGKNSLQSKSYIDTAKILAEILSMAFLQNSAGGIPVSPSDQILLRILKGMKKDSLPNQDTVINDDPFKKGTYSIIYISMPVIRPNQIMLFQKVYDSLSGKLKNSRLLPDDNGITILLSQKDLPPDDIVQAVDFLLISYPHQIGISYPFNNFINSAAYYRQAVTCIQFHSFLPGEHTFTYETCMVYDLLQNVLTPNQKKAAIHPAIIRLREDCDLTASSPLYLTLRLYLESSLNGTTAAERLHIHKNTLYYRLHQIEDLTGLVFEDHRLCDCLRMSCYLSDIEQA